jgi:hypothetical protein
MRPPFPGMDPWLEHPAIWPDVHNSLITAIRDELVPRIAPKYYAGIEQRVYALEPGELVFVGEDGLGTDDRGIRPFGLNGRHPSGLRVLRIENRTLSGVLHPGLRRLCPRLRNTGSAPCLLPYSVIALRLWRNRRPGV